MDFEKMYQLIMLTSLSAPSLYVIWRVLVIGKGGDPGVESLSDDELDNALAEMESFNSGYKPADDALEESHSLLQKIWQARNGLLAIMFIIGTLMALAQYGGLL